MKATKTTTTKTVQAVETNSNIKRCAVKAYHSVITAAAHSYELTDGLVGNAACVQVAHTFSGVPHRMERIRELNGITFINDSIASSPTRTIAGLHALPKPPVIILGGHDKHIPFDELGDEVGALDLLDVEDDFAAGDLLDLLAQGVGMGFGRGHFLRGCGKSGGDQQGLAGNGDRKSVV